MVVVVQKNKKLILPLMGLLLLLTGCAPKVVQIGMASYYGDQFSGHRTASGARFSQHKRTAAHRSIPFGTHVKVTNLENGRTVKVRINDRGPFVKGRIIDLSKKAARKLGMLEEGVVKVKIRYRKTKK